MSALVASATCQAHHCHAFACKNQVHCPPPPPSDSTPATSGWQTSWHIGIHRSHNDWVLAVVHKLMKMKREGHERRTCRNPYTHTTYRRQGSKEVHMCPCLLIHKTNTRLCLVMYPLSYMNGFLSLSKSGMGVYCKIHPSIHPPLRPFSTPPYSYSRGTWELQTIPACFGWKARKHPRLSPGLLMS